MVQFLDMVRRWFHTLGCMFELPVLGEDGRTHKSANGKTPAKPSDLELRPEPWPW